MYLYVFDVGMCAKNIQPPFCLRRVSSIPLWFLQTALSFSQGVHVKRSLRYLKMWFLAFVQCPNTYTRVYVFSKQAVKEKGEIPRIPVQRDILDGFKKTERCQVTWLCKSWSLREQTEWDQNIYQKSLIRIQTNFPPFFFFKKIYLDFFFFLNYTGFS